MLIDLSSDKGLTHFHAINSVLALPEFVKEADFQEQTETKDLPREAFADSVDRVFPVHTKAAAYMSYAYFAKQAEQMDAKSRARCIQGFNKAASFWNLAAEFTGIALAFQPKQEKQAELKPQVWDVIAAADELAKTRAAYTYDDRSKVAKEIMKIAADLKLPLSAINETVHKMAGFGITTKEAALYEFTKRFDNEKRPSLSGQLGMCIDRFSGLESTLIGGEVCEKLAGILDEYDRSNGQITFPEDVLFAFTKQAGTKMANSLVSMIDGTTYSLAQLEKAGEAFNILGTELSRCIRNIDGTLILTKVAELLDTLLRIDSELLKEALSAMGVHPVTMDKQAMVEAVVAQVQEKTPFTVVAQKTEKRANMLQRLEAQDPMVRRALDTMRRMKVAESKDEEKKSEKAPTARGIGGLFIKHAPNTEEAAPAK